MKKDWDIKKLGDICDFFAGYTPKQNELSDLGDIPYFKVSDMNRDGNELFMSETELYAVSPKKIISKDSIVFPKNGGAVFTNKKRILLQDSVIDLNSEGLFHKDYIDVMFLYYFLQLIDLKDYSKGAALPTIDMTALKNVSINVPPLEEQKRIVKILDEKFAQLESLKATAQTNLQNAKDLFQSQLAKAFNNTTWEKKRLGDVCEIRPSKSETTKYLSDDDNVSFLPMEDLQIMNYYIEPKQFKKLKEVSGSYTCFANGDVLLAKVTPCFENGKQGIAKDLTNGVGFGSSEYIVFRPASELLSEYLYYSLATSDFRENGKKHLLGACGLKRLSKDYVNEYNIPLPPLPEQKRIVKELDTLSEKVRQLQEIYTKQIANCEELKQSLLQKAFEGEL